MVGTHVSGTAGIQADILGLDIRWTEYARRRVRGSSAILLRNVEGTVSGNTIHDMYDADGEGNGPQTFGVLVYGDCDVSLLDERDLRLQPRRDRRQSGTLVGNLVRERIGSRSERGHPAATRLIGNGYEAGSRAGGPRTGSRSATALRGADSSAITCAELPREQCQLVVIGHHDRREATTCSSPGNTASGSDNGIAIMGSDGMGRRITATGNVLEWNDLTGNEYGNRAAVRRCEHADHRERHHGERRRRACTQYGDGADG